MPKAIAFAPLVELGGVGRWPRFAPGFGREPGLRVDRNMQDAREFKEKLRYIHRNPIKRDWWQGPSSSGGVAFGIALREKGVVEIESEWTARDREKREPGGPERIFLTPG
jgi:hypothetical protein